MFYKKSNSVIITIVLISIIMFTTACAPPPDNIEDKIKAEIKKLTEEIKQKGHSFTVGRNIVSHIPIDILCGLEIPKDWHELGKFEKTESEEKTESDEKAVPEEKAVLPSSFDWREHGCVTPVKNQSKTCNVCWAFATIGSYESAICVNGGPLLDLSEQYLIDCNKQNYTCSSGGWVDFNDMTGGVPLENCHPFDCPDRDCGDKPCKTSCKMYYPMADWFYVGYSTKVPDIESLKTAIHKYGPVTAGVLVNSAFKHYTGGIFDKCEDGFGTNHIVVLVGWNDDGKYWILKNSWSTEWGEQGYMRIKYNCSNIGYAAAYAIPGAVGTAQPEKK